MKTLSAALGSHIELEVTTLCTCWRIVRTDGHVFGFTDHDVDLVFENELYESETGYNRTAIANDSSFGVDNLDVAGFLDSDRISEEDLRNGLFDFASVYIFMVNWAAPEMGELKLRRGWFGEVQINQNGSFEVEIRGLNQALTHNFMESYSPECRADFCDQRCKLNLSDYKRDAFVWSASNSRSQFAVSTIAYADPAPGDPPPSIGLLPEPEEGADTYVGGTVTITSGDNAGKTLEIVDYNKTTGVVTLFEGFPYPVERGVTLEIAQGCDKIFQTCIRYKNQKNFRGEPHVPGDDELMKYPDAHS